MGSKTIAALGLVTSAAFIYYCVDTKKMEIAKACNVFDKPAIAAVKKEEPTLTKVTQEVEEPVLPSEKVEKSDPAFGVMFGEHINIVGMFATEAKEKPLLKFIQNYCENKECINDIRFSDDIKTVKWQEDMIALMQMFDEEHIEKSSLYINSNVLHIEGEIRTVEQKKRLEELIAKLKSDGLFVEDETVNMMTKVAEELTTPDIDEQILEAKKEVLKEENSSSQAPKEPETPKEKVVEKAVVSKVEKTEVPAPVAEVKTQEGEKKKEVVTTEPKQDTTTTDSQDFMNKSAIRFDDKVKEILPESKEILDKLAEQLKQTTYQKVEILGYAHSSEGTIFDMVVSQKKADMVKNYLFSKGVRKVISKGLGSQNSNNDIEIKIIK